MYYTIIINILKTTFILIESFLHPSLRQLNFLSNIPKKVILNILYVLKCNNYNIMNLWGRRRKLFGIYFFGFFEKVVVVLYFGSCSVGSYWCHHPFFLLPLLLSLNYFFTTSRGSPLAPLISHTILYHNIHPSIQYLIWWLGIVSIT